MLPFSNAHVMVLMIEFVHQSLNLSVAPTVLRPLERQGKKLCSTCQQGGRRRRMCSSMGRWIERPGRFSAGTQERPWV